MAFHRRKSTIWLTAAAAAMALVAGGAAVVAIGSSDGSALADGADKSEFVDITKVKPNVKKPQAGERRHHGHVHRRLRPQRERALQPGQLHRPARRPQRRPAPARLRRQPVHQRGLEQQVAAGSRHHLQERRQVRLLLAGRAHQRRRGGRRGRGRRWRGRRASRSRDSSSRRRRTTRRSRRRTRPPRPRPARVPGRRHPAPRGRPRQGPGRGRPRAREHRQADRRGRASASRPPRPRTSTTPSSARRVRSAPRS